MTDPQLPRLAGEPLSRERMQVVLEHLYRFRRPLRLEHDDDRIQTTIREVQIEEKGFLALFSKPKITVLVDDLVAVSHGRELRIKENESVLAMADYYSSGLEHRFSFHATLSRGVDITGLRRVKLELITPIYLETYIFVAKTTPGRPVSINLPMAGDSPIEAVEVSTTTIRARTPQPVSLGAKPREFSQATINLGDHGEVVVDGTLRQTGADSVQLDLKPLNPEANRGLDRYLSASYDAAPAEGVGQGQTKPDQQARKSRGSESKLLPPDPDAKALLVLNEIFQQRFFESILRELGWPSVARNPQTLMTDPVPDTVRLVVTDAKPKDEVSKQALRALVLKAGLRLPIAYVLVGPDATEKLATGDLGVGMHVCDKISRHVLKRILENWLEHDVGGSPKPKAPMGAKRILVVEDESAMLDLVEITLMSEGYVIDRAMDGKHAVQAVVMTPPNLILLDLDIPEIGGLDVLAMLREDDAAKDIPVIIVTGHASKANVQRAASLNVQGFLSKPFDAEQLKERVRVALARG